MTLSKLSSWKKIVLIVPLGCLAALCLGAIGRDSLHDLREQISHQQEELLNLKSELEWQTRRSAVNRETAELDVEAAQLEVDRLVNGDGPLEEARLRGSLAAAKAGYEGVQKYMSDLDELKDQGFFNDVEYGAAQNVLRTKKTAYEEAELQLTCYIKYVHPMRVRKAENHLRRCQLRLEEVLREEEEKLTRATKDAHRMQEELLTLYAKLPKRERDIACLEQ